MAASGRRWNEVVMPLVRLIESDSAELLALHLHRLGLPTPEAESLASKRAGVQALITGASREALDALRRLAVDPLVLGDPDRASGAALLTSHRAQLEALGRALGNEGPEAASLAEAFARALSPTPPAPTQIGRRLFEWGRRSYVMAIVNVTPDSFSDGGLHATADAAVAAGERFAAQGADLLDIGGESTRPGSEPVPAAEEIDRVVPVIERLARLVEVPISVDTAKAEVADAALRAGAALVNDISGFKFDVAMAPTIARHGAAACAMHIQGVPRTMQANPTYFDVVGEVAEHLQAAVDHAVRSGVAAERVLVDPGIGFGKTAGHNLFLLRNLGQLRCLGRPVLVGASRKAFIGKITGLPPGERLAGSLAVLSASLLAGADVIRVHDVAESVAAARMVDALARASEGGFAFGV